MDAISLLKNDHKTVNELFKKFERAGNSLRALQWHQMGTAPTADHLCLA